MTEETGIVAEVAMNMTEPGDDQRLGMVANESMTEQGQLQRGRSESMTEARVN